MYSVFCFHKYLFSKGVKVSCKRIFSQLTSCKLSSNVPDHPLVRVRFAPSPTGFLHLGGLRTALYNYLFAKKNGGSFILRIEDTDQQRVVPNAMEQLESDLNWAGIHLDESPTVGGNYGPYQQSKRLNLYQEEVKKLLENETAYYCFCSDHRLDLIRREAARARQIPKYDNRCRSLSKMEVEKKLSNDESHCIRFKLTPFKERVHDVIIGSFEHDIASIEGDPVIVKADGFPTYHFANVVDDHYMNISHVLRGIEWHLSTTKHILLYRAFGWQPPIFAHLPLLLNRDGSKISKRHDDLRLISLREAGVYPLAVINLVSHCGGGFKEPLLDSNIRTMEQLIHNFDLSLVKPNSCQLLLHRLPEFNHSELVRRVKDEKELESLKEVLRKKILEKFSNNTNLQTDDELITNVLKWSLPRIKSIDDLLSPSLAFVWVKPEKNSLKLADLEEYELLKLTEILQSTPSFEQESLSKTLRQFSEERDFKFRSFMMMLRKVLSGLKEGPSIGEMMELLGRENTVNRLKSVLKSS